MLKKLLKSKASKERIRQAAERQDVKRGEAEARARAHDLLRRLEDKKRMSNSQSD